MGRSSGYFSLRAFSFTLLLLVCLLLRKHSCSSSITKQSIAKQQGFYNGFLLAIGNLDHLSLGEGPLYVLGVLQHKSVIDTILLGGHI